MSRFPSLILAILAASPALAEPRLGLGRDALPEEIAAWDVNVMPDGTGLPDGSGDVLTGEETYIAHCAACHGDFAEGLDNWPKLAGGDGTLADKDPTKTVGSYWPYLSTLWDYVHRSMPFGQAQILTPDETYGIVAYILYSNDIVDEDFILSRDNFQTVALPNAGGFFEDNRAEAEYPAFTVEPCMSECKASVEVTRRASNLDVTPGEDSDDASATSEDGPDPALVAAGEKVFGKCKACHMIGEGATQRVGPDLNGIIGRAAGSVEGFAYSPALSEAGQGGLVWTGETLASFLANPKDFLPGTKMNFPGLKEADDLRALEAFLATHP